jgi:hypothetical protein
VASGSSTRPQGLDAFHILRHACIVAGRTLTQRSPFGRLWVRKEALVKLGATTLDTLREVNRSADPGRHGRLHLLDLVGAGWVGACAGAEEQRRVRPDGLAVTTSMAAT